MQPFNPSSSRAQKARAAQKFRRGSLKLSLKILIVTSLGFGVAGLAAGFSWGYLLLSPASFGLMLLLWNKGELTCLGHEIDARSIHGILDPDILANLRTQHASAFDVWQAASGCEARYFFENRFLIHPSIYDQLSKEPGTANVVWANAEALRNKYQTPDFHQAIIIVALLQAVPNAQQLLAQAKLDLLEIETGIPWLLNIHKKREFAAKKQRFGGWGRDLSFGYTPLLAQLGHNVSQDVENLGFFEDTSVHSALVDQMTAAMGSGNSTLALVGEEGVGKTTSVLAFAEHLLKPGDVPDNIRHRQVVALSAPTLISSARNPGEMEGLMIQILNEAVRAKNIILFFDDAYVFFNSGTGSVDLSRVLQPALESGAVRLIFAMTPKELQELKSNNEAVAARMHLLQVQPLNEADTIHVLRDQILFTEYQQKVLFTQESLKEAYRLGGRYIDSQAMPGAALSVLKSAAPSATDGLVTAEVVQRSVEASMGVKLTSAKQDESSVLLNLEDELHKYVINQKQAVSVIADALRRSRSGVGNQERPVGTFLFLGPTGVGKTELSKALARVYFGSEDAIVRVDMNQFVQTEDVQRLITPLQGQQLGFLGQMRRSPFSVVLLDEIEKAHSSVINLLLQMLDEGVMKDVDNKPVSFKDAIVIATSNAGANEIRRMLDEGEDIASTQAKLVDYIINEKIFAPEFVNRFDEVVVFRSLTPEELLKVIDLIIVVINKTLEAKKVRVELTEEAKKWLVEKGYDAKLGARPMRRVTQKYVENILAKRLLTQTAASGSTIKLDDIDFENLEAQN